MAKIRGSNNKTEVALRKAIFKRGLRYRLYVKSLPGRPDFVFTRERVAVFVDGDFWHARELQERGMEALEARLKTPNRTFWLRKLQRNVERDVAVTTALEHAGWLVIRLWESDVRNDLLGHVDRIVAVLEARRQGGRPSRKPI